jgi:RNA polymerase sigma factor (sigma-70 family)
VTEEDRKLVSGIKRGCAEAFGTLYRKHFSRIHRYAMSKLGSYAEAEDVTQEVFEAVLHGIDKYEGRAELVVWIYGISRNVIHNRIRRRARAHLTPLDYADAEAAPGWESPERRVQARVSFDRLCDVIDTLPADQQRILALRHEERLPIREIAAIMERSEDAVKSSLYRSRKTLMTQLPDELAWAS